MTGRLVRTPAVRLETLRVREGARLAGHGHDVPHLMYVAGGECEERHLGRWRRIPQGTWRVSPGGDVHDLVFTAPARCLLILVPGDPGGACPPPIGDRAFHRNPHFGSLAAELALTSRRGPEASPLTLEAQVLELLAATALPPRASTSPHPPAWLNRVRARIRDEPASPPSARALALEADVHPVYVARAFRHHFGIGLGEYARLVRAERARRLLAETDAPLSHVALAAGFADQAHLTRWTRRLLGRTPLDLRRRHGEAVEVSRVQYGGMPTP